MPPLPMIILAPEISNQVFIHLEKRKLAVAVTAPMLKLPSSSTAAAGEQWKFTLVDARTPSGGRAPSSTTLR